MVHDAKWPTSASERPDTRLYRGADTSYLDELSLCNSVNAVCMVVRFGAFYQLDQPRIASDAQLGLRKASVHRMGSQQSFGTQLGSRGTVTSDRPIFFMACCIPAALISVYLQEPSAKGRFQSVSQGYAATPPACECFWIRCIRAEEFCWLIELHVRQSAAFRRRGREKWGRVTLS
jgi:hypothetical protein